MPSKSCRNSAAALAFAFALAGCGKDEAAARAEAPGAAQFAELDRGVGLMGQFEFAAARDVFEGLAKRYPAWTEPRLDLAIATLNRQKEGDDAAAAQLLAALVRDRPGDLRAAYVLALLKMHGGAPAEAQPLFQRVAEADPGDAYAHYFLGQSLLTQGRAQEALRHFDAAAARDPQLRSAQYGASQALARLGRTQEAAARLAEFERTRNNPLARLAEFKYTRMGSKAEAAGAAPVKDGAVTAPAGPLFTAAQEIARRAHGFGSRPVPSAAELDGDGVVHLYLPFGAGAPGLVALRSGTGYGTASPHPLARIAGVEFAAWGDVDNDGRVDALLCGAPGASALVMQESRGAWKTRDVPALKKVGPLRDCALFDADHDGDLDLFLVTESGERLLLSNNGDGTFRSLTDRLPKPAPGSRARQVLAADLDDDRDLDLVILREGGAHEVLENERLWTWKKARGADAFAAEPALALAAARPDPDGALRLFTLTPQLAVRAWKRGHDGAWAATTLVPESGAPGAKVRPQIALADIDGDGRPEILATTPGGIGVWRIAGDRAERLHAIDDPSITAWIVAPLDDRGPSLVTYHADGSVKLHGPGPGRFPYAWIRLAGSDAKSAASRSNASAIGARVAARIAGRWVAGDTLRFASGPGQSLTPLALGLGDAAKIDSLSIDWPDGVFQTELALAPSKLHRIAETQRQLSSCPLIFAWNGERVAFVSDFLGVGGMGYLVAPGEYATPRPWENFLFPEGALEARDGRYVVKIGEPMEEAAYIDTVRLVAHDLPEGWDVALDERMHTGGPEVTGRAFYFQRQALPLRATNDRGEDVTASVRAIDRMAPDPGVHDRRFIGRLARDHALTLEFDVDLDAAPGQPLLVADGWIEYPYSQTMFAAWQAKAAYRAPTLEAKGADGRWRVVLKEFGYPAGMPRRMAVPLPTLPRGTRALRLVTNQEVYWDRLAIAWAEPGAVSIHELPLATAQLRHVGFPRRSTGPQQHPDYDYARRDPLWDTRVQSGRYTAFGDAVPLVAAHDDALAILGPGEELHLEFAGSPRLLPGRTRRYVLETRGWAKDMDLYTGDGETVGPLPTTGKPAAIRDALHRQYNTRFASGR